MKFSFIFVKPENPSNIGSAARAMKTMGHTDMRLVNPCEYLNGKARALAHGSNELLENAKIFSSLEEAKKDLDLLVATTARHRRRKYHYHDCQDVPKLLENKAPLVTSVGIVFGGETSGLDNDDLAQCDIISSIPLAATHPSINLSQAVMVFSFLLSQVSKSPIKDWRIDEQEVTASHYASLKKGVIGLIDELDMKDSTKLKRLVQGGLSRLAADDLYLVQEIRKRVSEKIESLRAKASL